LQAGGRCTSVLQAQLSGSARMVEQSTSVACYRWNLDEAQFVQQALQQQ
jgi:hypothetical protein